MRVYRFAKLVTATIKLKEARKVIRKWYVYCNIKRHLLVLHNLSFSATGGGPSPSQRGVPVPARGIPVPAWGVPILGGVPVPARGVPVPAGGGPSPSQRGVPVPARGWSQSQPEGGPSPSQGGPSPIQGRGVPVPAGGSPSPSQRGWSQPFDLSQHAILILPL